MSKIPFEIAFRPVFIVYLVATVLLFSMPDALAQSTCPPDSSMACAPDFSQWVVTFSYPEERTPDANSSKPGSSSINLGSRTKKITTTKTQNIVHEEFVHGDGSQLDEWHVGQITYTKASESKTWGQSGGAAIPTPEAFPANGFRGLDWIAKDNYVCTLSHAGRDCLVFALDAPPHIDPAKLDLLNTIAFVDAKTHLPVEARSFGVIRSFQFIDPPTERLSLPADLAQEVQQAQQARAHLEQRLPRPY